MTNWKKNKIDKIMVKKTIILLMTFISTILLTGCKEYLKFEITRYFSGFIISLVIGVVILIIMGLGGNKNDRK